MVFIFIDSILLAALIFISLAMGVGATNVAVTFLLKYKAVLIAITVLAVLVSEIVTYGEIANKIKATVYVAINMIIDLFLQIGYIAIAFTYLYCLSDNFKTHSGWMLLMFIPALAEIIMINGIAIGGGAWLPYKMNEGFAMEAEVKGISNLIKNIIMKGVWLYFFLGMCYMFLTTEYPKAYESVLGNTYVDNILKYFGRAIEHLLMNIVNRMK